MNLTEATKTLSTIWHTIRQNNPDVLDSYKIQAVYCPHNTYWYQKRIPDCYICNGVMYINMAIVTNLGSVEVLQNMLHEAAHSIAKANETKDTSRQGNYHNQKFCDIASEIGLICEWTKNGYLVVDVSLATVKEYKDMIDELEQICKG